MKLAIVTASVFLGAVSFAPATNAQGNQELSAKSVQSTQNARQNAPLMLESSKRDVTQNMPAVQNAIQPSGALSQRLQGTQKSATVTLATSPSEPVGAALPSALAR